MTTAFEVADRFVDQVCELSPPLKTMLGIPGSDHEWGPMFGIDGAEARVDLYRSYRSTATGFLDAPDPRDRLAAAVMSAAIDEVVDTHEQGDHFLDLSHMASSFRMLRSIFDVMKTDSTDDWDAIANRLETIGEPLADYRALLQAGVDQGIVVAARQVRSVVEQGRRLAGEGSSFEQVASKAESSGHASPRLDGAIGKAKSEMGSFADWLEVSYLPHARVDDGVGRDYYERAADRLVGMPVDALEAYRWGWEEFRRLLAEMISVGGEILPGEGLLAVKDHMETDRRYTVEGTDGLIRFVSDRLTLAVEALAGTHFDVPDVIRSITVQIAPAGGPLGVYYMRPSEDFSRPGGVWYSIGDQEVFPLYQHLSTAYHEGFPGHHLQLATAMYRKENISRFQRALTWYPGYTEGWGMYAEVLMGELGYLQEPGYYFGMLAKQMYRAARIVVDIGLHLGLAIDETSPIAPGEPWTFERACEFIEVYGFRTEDQARDEVLRYLGWPGQAIAYKLGEREILRLREETKSRLGDRFDLRQFHSTVVDNGTMRLDLLRKFVGEALPG